MSPTKSPAHEGLANRSLPRRIMLPFSFGVTLPTELAAQSWLIQPSAPPLPHLQSMVPTLLVHYHLQCIIPAVVMQ
ncbi:hypothetical protein BJX61DRAFT_499722 [Aspergillus egyptiacus]|nr:hypothetical protein BJX61DRAFT_499722 [Aspergillus egyptiacus]